MRAAYRNPKAKHLARFILVAIYTGTRSEAILSLRFMPHVARAGMSTPRAGLMFRRRDRFRPRPRSGPRPSASRAVLLAHLRRWERMGAGAVVVEIDGARVASVKTGMGDGACRGGDRALPPGTICGIPRSHGRCVRGSDKWHGGGFLRAHNRHARIDLWPPSPRPPANARSRRWGNGA